MSRFFLSIATTAAILLAAQNVAFSSDWCQSMEIYEGGEVLKIYQCEESEPK